MTDHHQAEDGGKNARSKVAGAMMSKQPVPLLVMKPALTPARDLFFIPDRLTPLRGHAQSPLTQLCQPTAW
jgi:hypothetical protein